MPTFIKIDSFSFPRNKKDLTLKLKAYFKWYKVYVNTFVLQYFNQSLYLMKHYDIFEMKSNWS